MALHVFHDDLDHLDHDVNPVRSTVRSFATDMNAELRLLNTNTAADRINETSLVMLTPPLKTLSFCMFARIDVT